MSELGMVRAGRIERSQQPVSGWPDYSDPERVWWAWGSGGGEGEGVGDFVDEGVGDGGGVVCPDISLDDE